MLTFEDDLSPAPALPAHAATPDTIRAQGAGGILSREPVHDLDVDRQQPSTPTGRVRLEDKRVINGQADVNQLVPVQVQVGVGQVPRGLREPLDAARDQHAARHRAVEEPGRTHRRRAADRQAQPRLLRHRGQPRRQQHRARHLPAHHRAGVPPVPAAAGVRGGDPHPRLPVHRREPGAGRGRDLQRLPRDLVDPRQGRVPDPVHRGADQPGVQDRHRRGRPAAPEEPDRLRLHHGGPVLLRRLRADPRDGSAEQDDRQLRAVPVHPARRVDALQLRHRPHQHDQAREPAAVDGRSSRPRSPS